MTTETTLQTGAKLVESWTEATNTPEPNRLDVTVEPGNLIAAVTALHSARWGYLSAITGLDLGVEAGKFEVLYHFCEGAAIITLRVPVPRENATVPSIYNVIPSVSFYERELQEMFGVVVEDTPNPDKLFLPDDWPDGVYPLRKDFKLEDAS